MPVFMILAFVMTDMSILADDKGKAEKRMNRFFCPIYFGALYISWFILLLIG